MREIGAGKVYYDPRALPDIPADEVLVTRGVGGLIGDAEHPEQTFGEVDLKLHDGRLVTRSQEASTRAQRPGPREDP